MANRSSLRCDRWSQKEGVPPDALSHSLYSLLAAYLRPPEKPPPRLPPKLPPPREPPKLPPPPKPPRLPPKDPPREPPKLPPPPKLPRLPPEGRPEPPKLPPPPKEPRLPPKEPPPLGGAGREPPRGGLGRPPPIGGRGPPPMGGRGPPGPLPPPLGGGGRRGGRGRYQLWPQKKPDGARAGRGMPSARLQVAPPVAAPAHGVQDHPDHQQHQDQCHKAPNDAAGGPFHIARGLGMIAAGGGVVAAHRRDVALPDV